MENLLPSYGEATARDPWLLIGQYLSPASLCNLVRVSQSFHRKLSPVLWGIPVSHFLGQRTSRDPITRERVYIAINKFKKLLPVVRPEVRGLTHTLQLPPTQVELYQRFRAEWLRDFLNLLPNLQSLIVTSLPLFDHSCLLSLHSRAASGTVVYPLRLLDASNCHNATTLGLGEAISHLPHLVYLDLSGNGAVRDKTFLANLSLLPALRSLKLCSISLRDEDLKVVAEAVQLHIRSLDVRNNHLTDQCVPILLQNCFTASVSRHHSLRAGAGGPSTAHDGGGSSDPAYVDTLTIEELQDESYDSKLAHHLTHQDVRSSSFATTDRSGITHLRIADNKLSIDGVAAFVHTGQLYVLDAGSPSNVAELNRVRMNAANYLKYPDIRPTALGDAQRLVPSLESSGQALTYVRIDHAVVSEVAPAEESLPLALSRLGIHNLPIPAGFSDGPRSHADPPAYTDSSRESNMPISASKHDAHSLGLIDDQKAALHIRDPSNPRGLLPGSLPSIRTLVLTQVPCFEKERRATDALISFICDCAQEAKLAEIKSQMLAIPRPKAGEIRMSRRKHAAHEFFPLQKLVLEMAPENQVLASTFLNAQNVKPSKFVNRTKSSTEDHDSESFWQAAEDDFSFFDDNGEIDLAAPRTHPAGKDDNDFARRAAVQKPNPLAASGYKPLQERLMRTQDLVDVVGELAKFRRERKTEFERQFRMGRSRYVDGYWPGQIQITRPYG